MNRYIIHKILIVDFHKVKQITVSRTIIAYWYITINKTNTNGSIWILLYSLSDNIYIKSSLLFTKIVTHYFLITYGKATGGLWKETANLLFSSGLIATALLGHGSQMLGWRHIYIAGLNRGVPMCQSTQVMIGSFRRGLNSAVVTF